MFNYFKSKTKIKKDSFEQGYKKAKKIRDDHWRGKINKLKTEAEELINEKIEEIKWRDKEIKKIKNSLDDFQDFITDLRFQISQIGQSKHLQLLEIAKEDQEVQRNVDEFESLYRKFNRKHNNTENKIDNYQIQKIKH